MPAGRWGKKVALTLCCMTLGVLCGAGLALLCAPASGDRTRHALRVKKEQARRSAVMAAEGLRDGINRLVATLKHITARLNGDEKISGGQQRPTGDEQVNPVANLEKKPAGT